jgi:MFS family permease
MKIGPITQFILIGVVVGTFLPFFVALCLFGTTLQSFVVAPAPTGGFYSGSATPVPTRVPSKAEVWTGTVLSSGGGVGFVLWSLLGAFAGEAVAVWRWGKEWGGTRRAWLGAVAGCVIFVGLGMCGLPR